MEELKACGLRYVVRYPADFNPNKKYPAVLFLHGAGTIGNDIKLLEDNCFFTYADKENLQAVCYAPQCDAGTVWYDNMERLEHFTREVIVNAPTTDKNHVALIGNSMGGYGSWQLAMSLNETFSAVVPICGGGMYWHAGRLVNTPIWAFHGTADATVFVEESKKMVEAVNKKGGIAKLTLFEGVGHNSWTPAYETEEMWKWMLEITRREGKRPDDLEAFADGKIYG